MKIALTYDDITLCPSFSEVESRQNINLETQLTTNYKLRIPLIASPMDTVCESEMAIAMGELGGVGIIHRFMTIEEQARSVSRVASTLMPESDLHTLSYAPFTRVPVATAVGANGDYLERAQYLVKNGANVILIDVAHGHHKLVKIAIENLKKNLPSHVDIIAGNVATFRGAQILEDWGADAIRVGIGGGSLCSTRINTGFGIPNVTSLQDCYKSVSVPIIACGGIRNSGDIAKALAVGADSVILGSLLAGTDEAPGNIIHKLDGLYKRYRGAASLETKMTYGQPLRNVEGESTLVPYKGSVESVVKSLLDGLRSALSYAGADSLKTFSPEIMQVTSAGMHEARPHLLGGKYE
jgi:IMP dehydrogenase